MQIDVGERRFQNRRVRFTDDDRMFLFHLPRQFSGQISQSTSKQNRPIRRFHIVCFGRTGGAADGIFEIMEEHLLTGRQCHPGSRHIRLLRRKHLDMATIDVATHEQRQFRIA